MKPTTVFFIILFCVNLLHAQNVLNGLVLYYPMNGDILDYSGYGNDGVQYATFGKDRNGNPGKAAQFNGVDQYIEIPHSSIIKSQLPVTVSFWIKVDEYPSDYNACVFENDYRENYYDGIFVTISSIPNNKGIGFNFGDGGYAGPTGRRSKKMETVLDTVSWHHIIGIIRGANDMDIYLDCVNDSGTYTGTGGVLSYTNNPGVLGVGDAGTNQPQRFFHGKLDDVAMWNRELTLQEIELVCTEGFNTTEIQEQKVNTQDILLYPNPTSGVFTVNTEKQSIIEVYDMFGQKIENLTFTNSVDISNLPDGVYYIKVCAEEQMIMKKLIKQKN